MRDDDLQWAELMEDLHRQAGGLVRFYFRVQCASCCAAGPGALGCPACSRVENIFQPLFRAVVEGAALPCPGIWHGPGASADPECTVCGATDGGTP